MVAWEDLTEETASQTWKDRALICSVLLTISLGRVSKGEGWKIRRKGQSSYPMPQCPNFMLATLTGERMLGRKGWLF